MLTEKTPITVGVFLLPEKKLKIFEKKLVILKRITKFDDVKHLNK